MIVTAWVHAPVGGLGSSSVPIVQARGLSRVSRSTKVAAMGGDLLTYFPCFHSSCVALAVPSPRYQLWNSPDVGVNMRISKGGVRFGPDFFWPGDSLVARISQLQWGMRRLAAYEMTLTFSLSLSLSMTLASGRKWRREELLAVFTESMWRTRGVFLGRS